MFGAPNGEHRRWVTHKIDGNDSLVIAATYPLGRIEDMRRRVGRLMGS